MCPAPGTVLGESLVSRSFSRELGDFRPSVGYEILTILAELAEATRVQRTRCLETTVRRRIELGIAN